MTPQPLPIESSTEMAATPEQVWSVLSDVTRMSEFSPELRKVIRLGRRRGLGEQFVGINRRGPVAWPTTAKVVRWEPGRAIAWHVREPGATWVYEIEPVGEDRSRVTARRVLPAFTIASKLMVPLLGGALGHDAELADGLAATLERIRGVVER